MTGFLVRLRRFAWPLPWTLAGLALALLAIGLGARARRVGPALEVSGGLLARALRALGERCPFVAITLGHVILGLDAATLGAMRSHEHVHVRQYECWGPLFVPLYLGSSLWQWLRGGDAYRDNRFEREAWRKA